MTKTTTFLPTETATEQLAARLASACPADGLVIFLRGELGAGKTTLVRGFLRALGYTGAVKSPTYTLVEPYQFGARACFHFDLYRIASADELAYVGLREYFDPGTICLIEWPERGLDYLPAPDLACLLTWQAAGRTIEITAHSARGIAMAEKALF